MGDAAMSQDPGTAPHEIDEALRGVVRAWDALPGGKFYSPAMMQDWLLHKMAPAIAAARLALGADQHHRGELPIYLDATANERGRSL